MAPASDAMRVYVWDLPTRLFHWSLVACVVGAFVTANIGGNLMVWHGRLGLAIFGLLVFRLIWGVIGSSYARFAVFVRGPRAILAYLLGRWRGLGHNPLGALSVLAMLGMLFAQAMTGLFANDDIAYSGYLASRVDADLSARITSIHQLLEKLLMALVALHIGAIAYYARVKKQNLVKPMLTGWAEGRPEWSAKGGGLAAFLVSLLIAALAVGAASGALQPPPPPPPATQAPAF